MTETKKQNITTLQRRDRQSQPLVATNMGTELPRMKEPPSKHNKAT
jgi:hypothetical protein